MNGSRCHLTRAERTAGAQPDGLSDTRAALHKGTLCAHLAMRVRRLICFLPFAPPAVLTGETTPRSLSGTDALPFPGAAVTQMRLLDHCQRRLTASASPPAAVGPRTPASVLKARRISGPAICFFSPLSRLRGCCAVRRWGVGGSCVEEGEKRKSITQAARSIVSLPAKLIQKETSPVGPCGHCCTCEAALGFGDCPSRSALF